MSRQFINKDDDKNIDQAVFKNLEDIILSQKKNYQYFKPILQKYLQQAILIEHSTIPPYLTALYSIKDGTNQIASQVLRSVVVEEMLHMILICNVMNALDLKPTINEEALKYPLYSELPKYPSKLFGNSDYYISISHFSKDSIFDFTKIEKPEFKKVLVPIEINYSQIKLSTTGVLVDKKEPSIITEIILYLDNYLHEKVKTIGGFYIFLLNLIKLFNKIFGLEVFKINENLQIKSEQYYGSGGKLFVVKNINDIEEVFHEIMGQGEGALINDNHTIYDNDLSQFGEGYELAHYFRFKEIYHEHFYKGGNYEKNKDSDGFMPVETAPNGKDLSVDWNSVYPIKSNAKLKDYEGHDEIKKAAEDFNGTYKKLLDELQRGIEGDIRGISESIMHMHSLKQKAIDLMRQPLNARENAAPTFEI